MTRDPKDDYLLAYALVNVKFIQVHAAAQSQLSGAVDIRDVLRRGRART